MFTTNCPTDVPGRGPISEHPAALFLAMSVLDPSHFMSFHVLSNVESPRWCHSNSPRWRQSWLFNFFEEPTKNQWNVQQKYVKLYIIQDVFQQKILHRFKSGIAHNWHPAKSIENASWRRVVCVMAPMNSCSHVFVVVPLVGSTVSVWNNGSGASVAMELTSVDVLPCWYHQGKPVEKWDICFRFTKRWIEFQSKIIIQSCLARVWRKLRHQVKQSNSILAASISAEILCRLMHMSNHADPLVVYSSLALSTIFPFFLWLPQAVCIRQWYISERTSMWALQFSLFARNDPPKSQPRPTEWSMCLGLWFVLFGVWSLKWREGGMKQWDYIFRLSSTWQVMWSEVMIVSTNFLNFLSHSSFRPHFGLLHASLHYLLAPCCDLSHLFGFRLRRHFQAFRVNLDLESET